MSVQAPARFAVSFERLAAERPDAITTLELAIAGRPVRARVAGDGLAALLARSFAPGNGDGPALRLELWDESETGIPAPQRAHSGEIGERWGPAGERFAPSADGRRVRFSGPEFEIHLDRELARAVGWIRGAARLNSWHRARPLQTLLMPWVNDLGMVAVHASMVARDGVGILVAGASGRGKSTTAAACAAAGLQVLGDDAIALELDRGDEVLGHCMHAAIKLRGEGLARHPELAFAAESCGPPWEDERVVFLNEARPESVAASARIAALCFPRLGEEAESGYAPMGRGRALGQLTGCNISVEPERVAPGFELIAGAVERLPAFSFAVGADTARVPSAVEQLLDELTR